MEEALNDTLAAQVEQPNKRPFSDNVPFVLDETVVINSGFRQFDLTFDAPPGLGGAGRGDTNSPDRQLLFYEIQHAADATFSDPVIIESPQTHLLIGGIGLGELRFFRIRVINTKFQASRFTSTFAATGARGRIIITPINNVSTRLTSDIGAWQTLFTFDYTPAQGKATVNTQLAVGAYQNDQTAGDGGPGHVQFRYLVDLTGTGNNFIGNGDRCVMAAIPGNTQTKTGLAPMAFGTYLSPFVQLPGSGTVKFRLQAALRPGSDWNGGGGAKARTKSDPIIFIRNAKVLEVLEKF
jgi:hypothetical protein